MLNRRANERPKLIPGMSRQRRETMIMSRDAFKHLLLKYCQREIRDGRDFCLASLKVLEYGEVTNMSQQAGDQLLRLVEDICLRNQREKDRLCRLSEGAFVLILPDTGKEDAEQALSRLATTLSNAKTRYHQKPLRASTIFGIAHSKDLGANVESLLSAIGLCLDNAGAIDLAKISQAGATSQINDSFDTWLKRYKEIENAPEKSTTFTALDSWSNEKISLRKFEFDNDLTGETLERIIKRTRILEELDHPGLVATRDFQFESAKALWLVKPLPKYPTLRSAMTSCQFDEATIFSWCHQLLNLLIYLQSLIPPLVPPLFNEDNLLVGKDGQLILQDFEYIYLFACLTNGVQSSGNTDTNYQAVIVSLGEIMRRLPHKESNLDKLLAKLENPLPKELDSAYKVRAALKAMEGLGKRN